MRDNPMPARPVAPGRVLHRELEARGWTQADLAAIIGRPVQAISEIISGSKQITPDTALELAQALGTSPEFWSNLQCNYQLYQSKQKASEAKQQEIARRSALYSAVPVRELLRRGWIAPASNADELERSVCSFLAVASLAELCPLAVRLRASTERGPEAAAQVAWIRRVQALAAAQSVPPFDAALFSRSIEQLLAHAEKPEGVACVPGVLREMGIHFVIVPHLPRTYLDGAAFWLDANPVVAVTLRYGRIDAFWFTLMHELAHILCGHSAVYQESVTPFAVDVQGQEQEASQLASDWLLTPEAYRRFVEGTRPYFSRKAVLRFAAAHRRHPGIVVGRLQHDQLLPYTVLRSLLVSVKQHLEPWSDVATAAA